MGTNYYLYSKPPCESCGRPFPERHIGKSSVGWCFSLHVYPDEGINTLQDWRKLWGEGQIKDEYGQDVTMAEMLGIVTERQNKEVWDKPPYGYPDWGRFFAENHAEKGPNGLLRHMVDGRYTIGHGEGTWDYCIGEFS